MEANLITLSSYYKLKVGGEQGLTLCNFLSHVAVGKTTSGDTSSCRHGDLPPQHKCPSVATNSVLSNSSSNQSPNKYDILKQDRVLCKKNELCAQIVMEFNIIQFVLIENTHTRTNANPSVQFLIQGCFTVTSRQP